MHLNLAEQRIEQRFVFQQKARLSASGHVLPIRTIDISNQGFGILCDTPLRGGQTCHIDFSTLLGERIVSLRYACKTTYCILTGMAGYRIGLSITEMNTEDSTSLNMLIERCVNRSKV